MTLRELLTEHKSEFEDLCKVVLISDYYRFVDTFKDGGCVIRGALPTPRVRVIEPIYDDKVWKKLIENFGNYSVLKYKVEKEDLAVDSVLSPTGLILEVQLENNIDRDLFYKNL